MDQENPLILMGALTGTPTREAIKTMLEKYHDLGIEQYMIYPRSGCELEYLSEEYFSAVENICREAESIGYKSVWLYDEFNWPSGSCAYQVPQVNKSFAAKLLCAVKSNGQIKIEIRRNDKYTNLMDPQAVDCFIESTYERYYQRLGKWFGTLIKGFFTDEPGICYAGDAGKDTIFCMGYYDGLEDDYHAVTNGDLLPDIAAGLRANDDFYPKVCAKLLAERFRKTYIDRVQSWCQTHHITLTGHLMNETSTVTSRQSNGEILKVLPGMGLPGMDEIYTKLSTAGCEWLTLATVMHAIDRRGNQGGLAELFAIGPCDISLSKICKMLWLTSAFGVDHYVLAVAAMDPRGNAIKKLYYNTFTTDQPFLELYPELGNVAKAAGRMATEKRSYEVAVRYGNGELRMTDLLTTLTRHQISWCLLDNDETPDESLPMVLKNLSNGCILEEKSNRMEVSFDYLWESVLQKHLHLSSTVCDANGCLLQDVFVRRYADGSVLVIDMSGTSRELFLHRNGSRIPFTLHAHAVAEFPGWTLEFDRPHLMRVQFDNNNVMELFLKQDQALKLAIREYSDSPLIELDGKRLVPDKPCLELPDTFNGLYRQIDLGTLSAGKHILKLGNDALDHPFLPLAILLGDKLPDYVGKITQKAAVEIPDDACKIKVAGIPDPGAAELLINNVSLGKKLTAPYEWIVPESARGSHAEIILHRWTSVGGLFGIVWQGEDERSRQLQEQRAPRQQEIKILDIEFIKI